MNDRRTYLFNYKVSYKKRIAQRNFHKIFEREQKCGT